MFKSRCLNEINVTSDRHRRRRHSPPRHYPASCLHCFHRHHYQLCRNHHHHHHHHDSLSPHHSPNLPACHLNNQQHQNTQNKNIYLRRTYRPQQTTMAKSTTNAGAAANEQHHPSDNKSEQKLQAVLLADIFTSAFHPITLDPSPPSFFSNPTTPPPGTPCATTGRRPLVLCPLTMCPYYYTL